MLRLLTLLATASCAIAAPFDITNLASSPVEAVSADSLGAAPATWKRIVTEAPWAARAGGNLEFHPLKHQFILHGVGIYNGGDESTLDDVWVAETNGKFKQQTVKTPFEPLYSTLSTQDKNGVQYRIQGTDLDRNTFVDVYRSADEGKNWVAQHLNSKSKNQLEGTRYLGAAVALVKNPSTLLVWGGQASGSDILSEVWRSVDSGLNWKFVVDTAEGKTKTFGQRSVNVGLASTMIYEGEEIDVVYQMMGYSGYDNRAQRGVYTNDIWISTGTSSSIGAKWTQIQSNAPWFARGDAQADMTDKGVLVVSSGLASYASDETENILNDVWASLDGGYSWGLCDKDAPFSDRSFQQAAIDNEGHIWVMGGRDADGLQNDIWKSVQSFDEVNAVAVQCNLLVPSCGTGLKCLPSSANFKSGLWGVTCDACPNSPFSPESGETPSSGNGGSSSGMSSMWTVAFVIVVIVAVGAAAAAYHFYRKSTTAAAGATEQAWWGKNGTSSLVGGDSAAPSDAMYNPLNIRDSNATM